jgi:CheY-like chemotaxis protein
MADVTELHQVILNLCTNAGQAMMKSGGKLAVELDEITPSKDFFAVHRQLTPGRFIRLSVEDTGCGMTQDVLQRVFEPFFTTRDVSEGTGMGLSVVHGIVNGLGGIVTAESEPGRGSVFTVYLPASMPQAIAETEIMTEPPHGNEHILIVDDEQRITTVLIKILSGLGYEVTAFTDSSAALAAFAADPVRFDLVLSDQTMPDITGEELAKKVLDIRPDIPVVLMTGYSQVLSREVAQRIGVREYLMKPVTKHNLATAIRQVLKA